MPQKAKGKGLGFSLLGIPVGRIFIGSAIGAGYALVMSKIPVPFEPYGRYLLTLGGIYALCRFGGAYGFAGAVAVGSVMATTFIMNLLGGALGGSQGGELEVI